MVPALSPTVIIALQIIVSPRLAATNSETEIIAAKRSPNKNTFICPMQTISVTTTSQFTGTHHLHTLDLQDGLLTIFITPIRSQ